MGTLQSGKLPTWDQAERMDVSGCCLLMQEAVGPGEKVPEPPTMATAAGYGRVQPPLMDTHPVGSLLTPQARRLTSLVLPSLPGEGAATHPCLARARASLGLWLSCLGVAGLEC